ncbi:MAG TPA: amidohydrolase family protein [Marmoricola sp.]|nr:amidohydrolase family protein [Marmoricola sp.]
MTGDILFRNVEVDGLLVDVRTLAGTITEISNGLATAGSEVVDGHGGALIPGLHDHHLHLLALAASYSSVDCTRAADLAALGRLIAAAPAGWVRAIRYDEAALGVLDRDVLDSIAPDRPVRVQHRSGALWILNSAALDDVATALDDTDDVERDASGRPNGRLWRYDERLSRALPRAAPGLASVGAQLHRLGITRVTDATPDLDASTVDLVAHAVRVGDLPRHVRLLGAPDGDLPPEVVAGPRKLLLHDHDLPGYDDLCSLIAATRAAGRAVAVHCVTRESLLLTLAALEQVGPHDGDRIEHGSVIPREVYSQLTRLGVSVVTQPDFLRTRGDDYLRDVAADDLMCLYPYASLIAAGVPVCASSDAPFGDLDPWAVMRSARDRRTASGVRINVEEGVDVQTALAGYLSDVPGGPPRTIAVGMPADVVLLKVPLATMLAEPTRELVRAVRA